MKKKIFLNYLIFAIIPLSFIIMLQCIYMFNGLFESNFLGILNDFIVAALFFAFINLITKNKTRKIMLTIFFGLASVILIADSIYYTNYNSFGSINSFAGIKNLFKGNIGVNFRFDTIIIIVISIATIFCIWCLQYSLDNNKIQKFVLLTSLSTLILLINFISINSIKNKSYESKLEYYKSETFLYTTFYSSNLYAQKFGYLNFRIRDIGTLIESKKAVVEKEDIEEIDKFFDGKKAKKDNEVTNLLEGYNLITLMCESIDLRFINETLTPNFYNLIYNDSFTFNNYYVPTFFEGATINTEYMSLNSLYPITASMWSSNLGDQYALNRFQDYSLPSQLRKYGYNTYYFHNNTKTFYSRDKLIPNYGFENIYFQEDLTELGYEPHNKDTNLIGFFENFVNYDELFYINTLTYSTHVGDDQYYKNVYLEEVEENYPDYSLKTKTYFCKLMEFDRFIGSLVDCLEEKNVLDNTAIVIYPDHYLYVDTDIYDEFEIEVETQNKEIHKQTLTLFVGGEKGKKLEEKYSKSIDYLGCTIDITPTILNLLGSDFEYKYFLGNDIFDNKSIMIFSDFTIFNGEYFLYLDGKTYDLENNHVEIEKESLFILLEEKVTDIDLSKLVLQLDFFKYLNEIKENKIIN